MSKIPKRFQQYFRHAVSFKCKVVPPPKTPSELQFITQSFQNLGTIDLLKSTALNPEELTRAGFQLNILFNPVYEKSWFSPVSSNDEFALNADSPQRNIMVRDKLVKKLENLIAIPRYLYVENDEKFLSDQRSIQFVHDLSDRGRNFAGKYDLSLASIEDPFISITTMNEKVNKYGLRAAIRSNIQHFHKFQDIEIHTNHRLIMHKLETNKF
ncbi:hypothetical protein CANMA_003966 [Candida margitis]|uniref:uncharacterized protein n=1 Tax=Candida margitis TaxID=1775924 RepID=UPI0022273FF2|nr:uncharacterized protein CANMA_003966 [Candida margitis]KAI5960704.1 hypothetical protein CANMA_003966 [Candida margitis]